MVGAGEWATWTWSWLAHSWPWQGWVVHVPFYRSPQILDRNTSYVSRPTDVYKECLNYGRGTEGASNPLILGCWRLKAERENSVGSGSTWEQ